MNPFEQKSFSQPSTQPQKHIVFAQQVRKIYGCTALYIGGMAIVVG